MEQAPYTQMWPTGSAYITGVDPQDVDLVQYCEGHDHMMRLLQQYGDQGWEVGSAMQYGLDGDDWSSIRKGKLNIILVCNPLLYVKWLAFTELARVLYLDQKVERIELCRAIVEGNDTAARNIIHLKGTHDTAAALAMGQFLMAGEGVPEWTT